MKYITWNKCKDCPFILQLVVKGYCYKFAKQIPNIDAIADFCEIEDYPVTVNEFLDGEI